MKLSHIILICPIWFVIGTSCEKEGTGGKASISGHVEHHGAMIPNATVYINYGAKEFPGSSSSGYDDETVANSTEGYYEFKDLKKGDYYLYATGYDSALKDIVVGGVGIRIKKKNAAIVTDIPVTE